MLYIIRKNVFDQKNQGQKAVSKATRPKSLRGLAGSDFLENDFRYTKGHLTKFWCATACNIALFQIWPKLLHKIVIFSTLRQFLATL